MSVGHGWGGGIDGVMGGGELMGGVDGGRKGVFCPNLYSPLCTSSSMNSKI